MQSNATLDKLLHKSPVNPRAHLADTTRPYPTNKWFSGLAFDQKNPVFAYPLSYKLSQRGFTVSYSQPVVNPNTVSTPHIEDIRVLFGGESTARVAEHDDLSVAMVHKTANTEAVSRVTQGSPYVFVTLKSGTARIETTGSSEKHSANTRFIRQNDVLYGVTSTRPLHDEAGILRADADFAVYIIPVKADKNTYADMASASIVGTSVTYQFKGKQYETIYNIKTKDDKPTIWGTIDQQGIGRSDSYGTLPTLAGMQSFKKGNVFVGSSPLATIQNELSISSLTTEQKNTVIAELIKDVDSLSIDATDTYFAGKQLYRTANLLQLAEQLQQTKQADTLRIKLRAELSQWLDPQGYTKRANKYFYYDTAFKGVVGTAPSFGSEEFNDHHFHYGYMIYAASILGRYDNDFMNQHQDMINVLVRDIASPTDDGKFPRLRAFDTYFGHSWASGLSPFGDGNNQESSSEAVLAWAAVYQWASVSKDTSLQQLGHWLYNQEAKAALAQWLHNDTSKIFPGFKHPFVSLVWGGKIDYATWFSDEPAAKLAIQLIPLSPAHQYVLDDTRKTETNVATVSTPTLFKDYYAMYMAKTNPKEAARILEGLAAKDIDGANSKAYALAWIYTTK
jgi:endoglucanase Acf2